MKTFVSTLYNYNFTGTEASEKSDEEDDEIEIAIQNEPIGGEDSQEVEMEMHGDTHTDDFNVESVDTGPSQHSHDDTEVVVIDD